MRTAVLFAIPVIALAQAPQKKSDVDFEVIHVRGNVYMFANDVANVTVQVGEHVGNDGVLMVDTGPAQLTDRIRTEIQKLSKKAIRYIINTNADADHIAGNAAFGKPPTISDLRGPQAATIGIFSSDPVLTRMSAKGSGVPDEALPTMTFEQQKDFTFDGEPVQMFPEPAAHTDGDSVVLFRGSNVIAVGDIFITTGYPVIDLAKGGSIQGEIRALNHILDLTVPEMLQEGGTMVIPGHGRLCDEADVVDYRDMVTIIRDRVADLIKKGKSIEEVRAARVSRDYDGRYNQPSWTGEMFVDAIYKSLKQEPASKGGER